MAELTISAADIASALKKNLDGFEPSFEARTVGRIAEVGDGIATVHGLPDCGVNELLEFEDGSFDAVFSLSSIEHFGSWADIRRSAEEIGRVLRPGGGLGLLWNDRDTSVPWVARLSELMEPYRRDAPGYRSGAWREAFERTTLFGRLGHAAAWLVHRLPPEGVVARVASVSFIAALPEGGREAVLKEVRNLLATDPQTRGRDEIELPYRTDAFWTRARGA